jgi:hypothetical protein
MAGAAIQPAHECTFRPARRQAAPSPQREGAPVPHDRAGATLRGGGEAADRLLLERVPPPPSSRASRARIPTVSWTLRRNCYRPEINEPLKSGPFGPGRPAALLHLFLSSCSLARRAEERPCPDAASASPVPPRDLAFRTSSGQGNISAPMAHECATMRHLCAIAGRIDRALATTALSRCRAVVRRPCIRGTSP